MHPQVIALVAAEHVKDMHTQANLARRARQARRARRALPAVTTPDGLARRPRLTTALHGAR